MQNMQFQEWVVQLAQIISDFAVAIAALAAAGVGVFGFVSWRRELVGKARYEAARAVMRKAFEFRRALDEARRRSGATVFSLPVDYQEEREDIESALIRYEDEIHTTKIDALKSASKDLQEMCWEAEILLGVAQGSLYEPFGGISDSVINSTRIYFEQMKLNAWAQRFSKKEADPDIKSRELNIQLARGIAFETSDDNVSQVGKSIVKDLQEKLKRHLIP